MVNQFISQEIQLIKSVLRAATNQLMEKIAQLSKQEYVPDTYASDAKDAIKKSFKDRTEFDEDDA